MDPLTLLAQAIARMEGYSVSGSRAARNNNPGNLRETARRIYPDLPRDAGGFIVFPSAQAGWDALRKDLAIKAARGWSLERIISVWAPASDGNDTRQYVANVAQWTGLDPRAPLPVSTPGAPTGGGPVLLASSGMSEEVLGGVAAVGALSLAWLVLG